MKQKVMVIVHCTFYYDIYPPMKFQVSNFHTVGVTLRVLDIGPRKKMNTNFRSLSYNYHKNIKCSKINLGLKINYLMSQL
jgi:hypothetical protein